MPKFILATAASLLRRPFSPAAAADAQDPLHATTRSRDATRRLRASRIHDPYFHLSPLQLTKRH